MIELQKDWRTYKGRGLDVENRLLIVLLCIVTFLFSPNTSDKPIESTLTTTSLYTSDLEL